MEYMSTVKDAAGPWGQTILLIAVVAIMLGLLIKMMKSTADSVSALRSDIREFEKEQKEREAYAAWAFPYGPEQQAKLRALLAQEERRVLADEVSSFVAAKHLLDFYFKE